MHNETQPVTRAVQKIFFPEPVDPFGKASGRHLLKMGRSQLVRLLELTQGNLAYFSCLSPKPAI